MKTIEYLAKLKQNGIIIQLVDNQLKISGDSAKLTKQLLEELKSKKDEIINFLSKYTKESNYTEINYTEKKEYYSATSAQISMYFMQQMNLSGVAYNLSGIIPIPYGIGKQKTKNILLKILNRHESFKYSFEMINDIPRLRVNDNIKFNIEEIDIKQSDLINAEEKYIKPFDLSIAPLVRMTLLITENQQVYLLIDVHHIISDALSISILKREFEEYYSDGFLKPLKIQYKDYSEWKNSAVNTRKRNRQASYWRKIYADEIPVLRLPTDFNRPPIQSFSGETIEIILDDSITKKLNSFAKSCETTVFMSLLSFYSIFLNKISSQNDIVIGIPVTNRQHTDLNYQVGMFVNTLPIRVLLDPNKTIEEFTKDIKQICLTAFDNQDYQFDDLINDIELIRDTSRNPLFDVSFNYLKGDNIDSDINPQLLEYNKKPISKFDLSLTVIDYGERLVLSFEYCTKLFNSETVNSFIIYFLDIIDQISDNYNILVDEINIAKEYVSILNGQYSDSFGDF